jgi:hypothetical protein
MTTTAVCEVSRPKGKTLGSKLRTGARTALMWLSIAYLQTVAARVFEEDGIVARLFI